VSQFVKMRKTLGGGFSAPVVLVDELPYLPTFHCATIRGTRDHVHGFRPNPFAYDNSWNANEWWIKRA
jgi:ABC-type transport system substrate-binding protein